MALLLAGPTLVGLEAVLVQHSVLRQAVQRLLDIGFGVVLAFEAAFSIDLVVEEKATMCAQWRP